MPNKLTDTEIKKALEHCVTGDLSKSQIEVCEPCPYFECGDCTFQLKQNALDLINRQEGENEKNENIIRVADKTIATLQAENESLKAEIERLNNNISAMATTLSTSARATRHEAYRECVEVVKKLWGNYSGYEFEKKINNLLNECVGDGNSAYIDKQN